MYSNEYLETLYDLYDVKVKVMGNYTEITQYSDSLKKLKTGKESPFKMRKNYEKSEKGSGEIRTDSLNRSFARLMDLSLTNHDKFKTFITLTFKENISDLSFANKQFNYWANNVRKVFPNFKYLGVPEFQKRGAVHYHLMTNLEVDTDLVPLQKYGLEKMYDVKYWKHGFSSVFDLKLTDDNFSVALYLSKYFYKDIDNRLFGRRKILASRNLSEPNIYTFDSKEIEKINEFVQGKTLQKEKSYTPASVYAPDTVLIRTYK